MPAPRNNYLLIVFDSCRYDTFIAARPRNMRKLGRIERRWSYATWTAPSHFNLLTGLMPHLSPKRVYASEYYKTDFLKFKERLGDGEIEFKSLVSHSVPAAISERAVGVSDACARVSSGIESSHDFELRI